jgi:hypothetical protein
MFDFSKTNIDLFQRNKLANTGNRRQYGGTKWQINDSIWLYKIVILFQINLMNIKSHLAVENNQGEQW